MPLDFLTSNERVRPGLCSRALNRTWVVQNYEKASVRPLKYLLLFQLPRTPGLQGPVCLVAGCKPTLPASHLREGCAPNVGIHCDSTAVNGSLISHF